MVFVVNSDYIILVINESHVRDIIERRAELDSPAIQYLCGDIGAYVWGSLFGRVRIC